MFLSLWGGFSVESSDLIINDITQLNPIVVDKIISPTTEIEIIDAIKNHDWPISIWGGRNSMWWQTATEWALFINMREYNKVVSFDKEAKTITVQAGSTWYDIQKHIDEHDLSVKIMQSYANFSVGGSMSVNAHGRYMWLWPVVWSVLSYSLIWADGGVLGVSPEENSDLFYGAIWWYGGLWVISEVTLQLVENTKIRREKYFIIVYKWYFTKKK